MVLTSQADGAFELHMGAVERRLLVDACDALRAVLEDRLDDPVLRRLFPTAYADDHEREAFYQQMARDDLRDSRIAALARTASTAGRPTVTVADLEQWLTAINAVRLVLGTKLDVSEDPESFDIDEDDPEFASYVVYEFLGHVLESVVRALSQASDDG